MHYRRPTLALLLLCAATHLPAQAPSPQLNAVLAQMDTASKNFKSATANFQWEFTEKVAGITDTSKQKGSMYIERARSGVSFGANVFDLTDGNTGKEPSKVINFEGGTALIYTPTEKHADRLKAGAGQSSAESFLSLGFGGSGHDLASAWTVTDGGPVTLTEAGHPVKTEKLILVSKDAGVRNNFKQVFDTPSGDERVANYTDIRLNGKVDKGAFKIPTKGVNILDH